MNLALRTALSLTAATLTAAVTHYHLHTSTGTSALTALIIATIVFLLPELWDIWTDLL